MTGGEETVCEPRRLSILGSTSTIGVNTLDVVARYPARFEVVALTANRKVALLAEQARATRAAFVAIGDESAYGALKAALAGTGIEIAAGREAIIEAARREAEIVMAAIVGAAGLEPVMAAVERGACIALANKEALVCAGSLVTAALKAHGATLLPVDSEHNAIFQVFDAKRRAGISRLILTASGGPFRTSDLETMRAATPAQAVAHPNWVMGAKISVDSATMMNKGLELIEASHLFAMPEEQIDILVHPQSVIHSMVEYCDGSVLAQLGSPDMRVPIAYALAWPERLETGAARLDLAAIGQVTFEAPNPVRFPALRLARDALKAGGGASTVLNAANEVAVETFLAGRIGFLDIARVVEETLGGIQLNGSPGSIAEVIAVDGAARDYARTVMARSPSGVSTYAACGLGSRMTLKTTPGQAPGANEGYGS